MTCSITGPCWVKTPKFFCKISGNKNYFWNFVQEEWKNTSIETCSLRGCNKWFKINVGSLDIHCRNAFPVKQYYFKESSSFLGICKIKKACGAAASQWSCWDTWRTRLAAGNRSNQSLYFWGRWNMRRIRSTPKIWPDKSFYFKNCWNIGKMERPRFQRVSLERRILQNTSTPTQELNANACLAGIIPRSSTDTDWFGYHNHSCAKIDSVVLVYT